MAIPIPSCCMERRKRQHKTVTRGNRAKMQISVPEVRTDSVPLLLCSVQLPESLREGNNGEKDPNLVFHKDNTGISES